MENPSLSLSGFLWSDGLGISSPFSPPVEKTGSLAGNAKEVSLRPFPRYREDRKGHFVPSATAGKIIRLTQMDRGKKGMEGKKKVGEKEEKRPRRQGGEIGDVYKLGKSLGSVSLLAKFPPYRHLTS